MGLVKKLSPLSGSRYPLAIVAGLVLAAAFPRIGLAGFAWIGPGLMFSAALGTRGWERFRIGYVAGLACALASFYWLLLIPYRWHGIPLAPAAGWIALCAYLGVYPAVWVCLTTPLIKIPNPAAQSADLPPSIADTRYKVLFEQAQRFAELTWSGRIVWAISGAAAWVALEMVLTRLFSGLPWDLLGVSQYQMLPLIQIAAYTGVYGVSFLIVWVSLSFFLAVLALIRQPGARSLWLAEIVLPVLAVAVTFNFGFRELKHPAPTDRSLRVTFVQPSIPQTLIWDPANDDQRFNELIHLSEEALTNRADLLVWPESAIPKLLRYNKETFEAVTGLARKHHVWFVVGSDDTGLAQDGVTREFYNSSFLISPEGDLVEGYRKRSLVIFGEYLPLERWMAFLKFFSPIQGGFTPGNHPVQFALTDLKVKLSPLICFEDVFPQLGREATDTDTDILVNMTNDGWFGESAEPLQHAATALFRTVENGRILIRCTNTGMTCWIDAQGRLRQVLKDRQGTIYGPGIMTAEIPLPPTEQNSARTFYNVHGDLFGWACVVWTALMLARRIITQRRAQSRIAQ